MANDGFIEFLSPNALSEMEKANAELVKMVTNVKSVQTEMGKINTPSGGDSKVKQLTAQYEAQQKVIAELQSKIKSLSEEKQKYNQKTQEEITNGRILASNANRQVLATSQLAGAYRNLSAQVAIASERVQNIIARGRTAEQTQRQFNKELRIAQNEFRNLQNRVLSADKAVDKWNRTGERSISLGSDLLGAFGVVGGVTAFALITKDIFEQTKEIQSLNNALKLVTETQENFYSQQVFLSRISESYGVNINDLTKQFTQFYVSAKDKISANEIQRIFESITKAGASMGISVESQQRAFLALNQMMSKGTIQAEELRGQLGEALPGAFGIMAKAVGVTEKELAKMMKAGDLLASEVLPKFAKQLEITYGIENVQRIESLTSAQNRFSNAWRNFVANLDKDGNKLSAFFKTLVDSARYIIEGFDYLFQSSGTKRENELKMLTDSAYKTQKKALEDMDELKKQSTITERDRIRTLVQYYAEETQSLLNRNKILRVLLDDENTSFENAQKYSYELRKNNEEINKNNNLNSYRIGQLKAMDEALMEEIPAQKAVTKETQEQIKAREKAAKDAAQAEEQRRKDKYNVDVSNIEREIERAKDKFNIVEELNKNELGYFKNGVAKKMKLSMDLAILELKLAQRVADEKKRLAQGNKALGIAPTIGGDVIAENEYATESVNIAENYTNRMDKINKDYFKSFEDAVPKDWSSKTPTMWTPEQIKKAEDDAEKIKEIQKKLKDEFRNYIQSFGQDFFGNAGFGETFDFFLRMDENGKTMFDKLGDLADGSVEKFAATFQAIAESAQEAFNFISEASQKNFEAEYNRLEEQKNVALLFAGESTEAREEIERQYEQRRKEIARREAKAKKQQAIFNIAIDTAQGIMAAVMKSPLTGGLPWSAIVAAIGAAQIAMVSSQEIPQYWKGTDNAEGGLAWTQERGREIITDSQGRVKSLGSDKGAELTMLSKGDKVFTAEKSAMMFDDSLNGMLLNNGIVMPKIEVSMDTQILGSKLDKLSATIASKESFSIVRDAKGERIYQRKQNERKELLNNILNVKTYGV